MKGVDEARNVLEDRDAFGGEMYYLAGFLSLFALRRIYGEV